MRWSIEDFKGICEAKVDIGRGKTTILTGINSSGKSSLIQSLLLVAQSLHSQGPVVLNGPLVRLGDAQDLVREESESGCVVFSMDINTSKHEEVLSQLDLRARYELVPSGDGATLQPRRVEITVGGELSLPFVIANANSRANDVELAQEVTSGLGQCSALHIKSLLGSENRQLRTYVILQGMKPAVVVQAMEARDIAARYRKALEGLLEEFSQDRLRAAAAANSRAGRAIFIREFVRLVAEYARRHPSENVDELTRPVRKIRNGNPYAFEETWGGLESNQRERLVEMAVESRALNPFVLLPVRGSSWGYISATGVLESALEAALGDTFAALGALGTTLESISDRVQYLGPLRDEPRVVWNHWNELARSLPVGTRGEYSAAVLSRSNTDIIRYVTTNGNVEFASLGEAVNDWLGYLEIGDTVAARSHGKLGVGLDLSVAGHVRDLTSVGVGVSQTLPLLVGLLATPLEGLFIVEQPELHLHPAVQARLADFMLTSRPDLSLIVETHSDAFVTRVRRRVAEGTFGGNRVDVTFVEPGLGGSTARALEISEFGDLSEWPDGFISSAEEDVRAILRANIRRSKGQASNDN